MFGIPLNNALLNTNINKKIIRKNLPLKCIVLCITSITYLTTH